MIEVVEKRNHVYLMTESKPVPSIEICEYSNDITNCVRIPVQFVDAMAKALYEARDQLAKG